jgi:hypothetical protein
MRLALALWTLFVVGCTCPGGPGAPDGAMPDASVPDASVPAPVALTLERAPTALRVHSTPQGQIDGTVTSLGARAVVLSAEEGPGCVLWGTDGTAAGTEVLARLPTEPDSCSVQTTNTIYYHPLVVQNAAYFMWPKDSVNYMGALWRSDGTRAGTRRLGAPGEVVTPIAFGDRLFLLWQSAVGQWSFGEYLPAQDAFVELVPLGAQSAPPQFFGSGQLGTRMLLDIATYPVSGSIGAQLWETDGTPAGTSVLAGANAIRGVALEQAGRLVFVGPQGLYAGDGTSAGTMLVENTIFDGGVLRYPDDLAALGSQVLFVRHGPPLSTLEIAALDPTAASASALFPTGPGAFMRWLLPRAGELLYVSRESSGFELRGTDGGAGPPRTLAQLPIPLSVTGLYPETPAIDVGTRVVFHGGNGSSAPRFSFSIYSTDGTSAGSEVLLETWSNGPFAKLDAGLVLFDGTTLWNSDATAAGTSPFINLWTRPPPPLVRTSKAVFFVGRVAGVPSLWSSDGTMEGSVQRSTLTAEPDSSNLYTFEDRVAYLDSDFASGTASLVVLDDAGSARRVAIPNGTYATRIVYLDGTQAVLSTLSGLWRIDLLSGSQAAIPGTANLQSMQQISSGRLLAYDGPGVYVLEVVDPAAGTITPLAGAPTVGSLG